MSDNTPYIHTNHLVRVAITIAIPSDHRESGVDLGIYHCLDALSCRFTTMTSLALVQQIGVLPRLLCEDELT